MRLLNDQSFQGLTERKNTAKKSVLYLSPNIPPHHVPLDRVLSSDLFSHPENG